MDLTAYRVLMMLVYGRTESLLVATEVPTLAYAWAFDAALWLVVAAAVVAKHGQLSRQPLPLVGRGDHQPFALKHPKRLPKRSAPGAERASQVYERGG